VLKKKRTGGLFRFLREEIAKKAGSPGGEKKKAKGRDFYRLKNSMRSVDVRQEGVVRQKLNRKRTEAPRENDYQR